MLRRIFNRLTSCSARYKFHQGHMKFLDKTDKKALGKWMETNFVSPLKRLDKKDHACATCHGEDFDPKFLDKWEAEAKK